MPTSKELREKRAKLVPEIRALADRYNGDEEGRQWTAEDEANWERLNEDYNELTRQIEEIERGDTIRARIAEIEGHQAERRTPPTAGENRTGRRPETPDGPPTEEDRAVAFQAWARHQMDLDLEERHVEACRRVGLNPQRRQLEIRLYSSLDIMAVQQAYRGSHPSLAEQRALSAHLGSSGAFTIPQGFVNRLEIALLAFSGPRADAEVIRTDGGEEMPWPTANDTGNKGRLIGEGAAVDTAGTTTSAPSFGKGVLYAYNYTSDGVLVPSSLLQDSAFNLAMILPAMLGERLGRIQADHFTTGDAAAKPQGIVTGATLGVTAASATAIAADELIDLEHSVDPAYRNGARYAMHDTVLSTVRKLKDGEGRYLWSNGLATGAPDTINGYGLSIYQSMASSVIASAKTVLFGNLRSYKVRDVGVVRIYRLQERYREYDQDGFMAFMRCDGMLLDAGTHPVKYLQQHS